MENLVIFIATMVVIGVVAFAFTHVINNNKIQKDIKKSNESQCQKEHEEEKKQENDSKVAPKGMSLKQLQKQKFKGQNKKKKIKHIQIDHEYYLNSAMHFSDTITDYHFCGHYLCVSSQDKSIKIFDILTIKEEQMKFYSQTYQFEYPTAISMSENMEYVAVALSELKTIKVYSFNPKSEEKKHFKMITEFQNNLHDEEITKLHICKGSQYVVSFADQKDTKLKIWDLKSKDLLHTFPTGLAQHFFCSFSDNLLLPSGWVSDLKVYRMGTDKSHNNYAKLEKVLTLAHNTGINFSSISDNEQRVITISHDNCLKIWNVNVQFHIKEDAKILRQYEDQDFKTMFPNAEQNDHFIAGSSAYQENSKKWLYAIASREEVVLLDSQFEEIQRIKNIMAEDCHIDQVQFVQIKHAHILLVLFQKKRKEFQFLR